MSVKCPVNEQTSVVCCFKKELFQLVKLLYVGADNRKSGMIHRSIAVASAKSDESHFVILNFVTAVRQSPQWHSCFKHCDVHLMTGWTDGTLLAQAGVILAQGGMCNWHRLV
jgi:hypothetical protein